MNFASVGLIDKKEDGSERVNYQNDDFPSYLHVGNVFPGARWTNKPHFHEDLEFITITKGVTGYNINGEKLRLEQGDTLMVNKNQIHYSFTIGQEDCSYFIAILHPSILCSNYYVQTHYVELITDNQSIPYLHFKHDEPIAQHVYKDVEYLIDSIDSELSITICFFRLFKTVFNWCRCNGLLENHNFSLPTDAEFKVMLKFIQTNYAKTVTLADIAKAGGVGKTHCNTLFKKYTGSTPMDCLNHCRAERVAYFVTNTGLSMSEIAEKTGYSSACYMTEVFKKIYGVAPRTYALKMRNK